MDFFPDYSWAWAPLFVPLRHGATAEHEQDAVPLGYLAFAHDLIAATGPKLIVQVGSGAPDDFYFACCQSVAQTGSAALCYALYPSADDGAVRTYNESQYSHFSHLVRIEEQAGRAQFTDRSIDLLYLHAGPRYESVRDVFRSWLPKLRPGAVILVPDIGRREAGFGVWRLWVEITAELPLSFAFAEGRGLGVVRIPAEAANKSTPPLLSSLFGGSASERDFIRRYYVFYTAYLRSRLQSLQPDMTPDTYRTLLLELQTAQAERMLAVAEFKQVVEQRNAARREIYQLEHDLQAQKAHSAQLDIDVANWKQMGEYERNIREEILASLSWKLTAPLRVGIAWVRKLRG
jgi:hypothetical protein